MEKNVNVESVLNYKKVKDLSRDEILALPRFEFVLQKNVSIKYNRSSYTCYLKFVEIEVKSNIEVVDYEFILESIRKSVNVVEKEIRDKNGNVTTLINTISVKCPCRFFKGISKSTGNEYHMVQVIVRKKSDDDNIITQSVFLKNREYKYINIQEKKGMFLPITWLENNEVITPTDEVFTDDLFD